MSSGCGGEHRLVAVEDDGITAVVSQNAEGGMDALVVGTLVTGPGNCLALESPEGRGPTTVVAWPEGTRLLSGQAGVDVPGLGGIQVGDAVEAVGGYVTAERASLPEACRDGTSPEIAILSPDQ